MVIRMVSGHPANRTARLCKKTELHYSDSSMLGIGDTSINTKIIVLKIKFFMSLLPMHKKGVADGIAFFLPSNEHDILKFHARLKSLF